MNEVTEIILTTASIFTALGVIVGIFVKAVGFFDKQREQSEDIARMKDENVLIVYGLRACLDGLEQLGCNHTVPVAKDKLDKYINQQAHR